MFLNISLFYMCEDDGATSTKTVNAVFLFLWRKFSK